MEKEVRASLWIEDGAIRVQTDLADFDGTVDQWKIAFYEVWRYQMTWDFAYSIRVDERRESGVYMSLLIQKSFQKQVRELLESLGCKKITEWEEHIGIVQMYDIDDPVADDMFEVFAE